MKWMITFVGVLTVLGGIWPLVSGLSFIPAWLSFIPSSGAGYQAIIIIIGIIAIAYGVRQREIRPIR